MSGLGVSEATLRNWEREGKLAPSRDPINGYRLFKKPIWRCFWGESRNTLYPPKHSSLECPMDQSTAGNVG